MRKVVLDLLRKGEKRPSQQIRPPLTTQAINHVSAKEV